MPALSTMSAKDTLGQVEGHVMKALVLRLARHVLREIKRDSVKLELSFVSVVVVNCFDFESQIVGVGT